MTITAPGPRPAVRDVYRCPVPGCPAASVSLARMVVHVRECRAEAGLDLAGASWVVVAGLATATGTVPAAACDPPSVTVTAGLATAMGTAPAAGAVVTVTAGPATAAGTAAAADGRQDAPVPPVEVLAVVPVIVPPRVTASRRQTPFARGTRVESHAGDGRRAARRQAVTAALLADPGRPNAEIAREVAGQLAGEAHGGALLHLVQQVRRELEADRRISTWRAPGSVPGRKQQIAAAALLADPARSNREIAMAIGTGHKLVTDVRHELEAAGEIPCWRHKFAAFDNGARHWAG